MPFHKERTGSSGGVQAIHGGPPASGMYPKWSLGPLAAEEGLGRGRGVGTHGKGEVTSLPNMPYMGLSLPGLTRSASAISSLQDIHEIRSNLPRQLKYSFWQR